MLPDIFLTEGYTPDLCARKDGYTLYMEVRAAQVGRSAHRINRYCEWLAERAGNLLVVYPQAQIDIVEQAGDGIYAIVMHEAVAIKRLQRLDAQRLMVKSDNYASPLLQSVKVSDQTLIKLNHNTFDLLKATQGPFGKPPPLVREEG